MYIICILHMRLWFMLNGRFQIPNVLEFFEFKCQQTFKVYKVQETDSLQKLIEVRHKNS